MIDFIRNLLFPELTERRSSEHEVLVSDGRIISAMDPWMLACAVGAKSGHRDYPLSFESWLSLSSYNWMPEVQQKTGASRRSIASAVREYAERNKHRDYREVLAAEEVARGHKPTPVLGPGESMTVEVSFRQ